MHAGKNTVTALLVVKKKIFTVERTVTKALKIYLKIALILILMTLKIKRSSTLEYLLMLLNLEWWNQEIFERNFFTAFGGVFVVLG